jgi:hypothetical protein
MEYAVRTKQDQLIAAAKKVKEEITAGKVEEMDYE